MRKQISNQQMKIALIWCLAWGNKKEPSEQLTTIQQLYQEIKNTENITEKYQSLVEEVEELFKLNKDSNFPETVSDLQELTKQYENLWNNKIGLVYGGATKIKQYVFETSQLPYIRGASALLDRINLVDIPCFFGEGQQRSITVETWLDNNFPQLRTALIPELLIYYKGGNVLAFCPVAWIDDLANAIEKRYTEETLTANSCAVGEKFKPLEMQLGILPDKIDDDLFWLEKYKENQQHPLVKAYYNLRTSNSGEVFRQRKSFNELVTKLATKFNQRRSGNKTENRSSRAYPPILETHPYLVRDNSDRRLSMAQTELPNTPNLSEVSARKRLIGEIAKREASQDNLPPWYRNLNLQWHPRGITIDSWVKKFEDYLEDKDLKEIYYRNIKKTQVKEALSLREIGNYHQRFLGYIYADGNNMGGYIQTIKTPQEYKRFSEDIFEATESSVYKALAEHLHPHQLNDLTDPDNEDRNGILIHPFEIITIGGDDVMLIVPGNKALAIAKTIGEKFEEELKLRGYKTNDNYQPKQIHRYQGNKKISEGSQCLLSMSSGVLITAENTPIYYAENLMEELLKSAKTKGKSLKKLNYYGGTIDFFVMKSVTMLCSKIKEFRQEALSAEVGEKSLRLYAAPYTLYEIEGLLASLKAIQESEFPKSQLYQIRNLLLQGKNTAILNYRYFRTRLKEKNKTQLQESFEQTWCSAKSNKGNIAPWMYEDGTRSPKNEKDKYYETIWRDLVDLLSFEPVTILENLREGQETKK